MNDLVTLLDRLIQAEVEFVIVGGYAAVAHGCTLLTQDMDICCPFTANNLLRIQDAVHDLHPVHRMTPKRLPLALTTDTCRGLKNLYLDTDWGVLDCMSEITGLGGFAAVKAESMDVTLPVGTCLILSRAALIRSKAALGRPRDIEAIKQLRYIEEQERGG